MDTVTERVERLNSLHPKFMDLSLGRIQELLAALGNPQEHLPPTIHVAGTNGKGSTIAHMRSILEAGGYRVHVDTSPHLVRYNERFRLAGTLVSDEKLLKTLSEVEEANDGKPVTLFEITTALGFLLFSRNPADALLLEVGLGGRQDATNAIAKAAATVITPISFDHTDFLGDTLGKIAHEKAGIIKESVPCIVSHQDPAAMQVIEEEAARLNAPLYRSGMEWTVREDEDGISYEDGSASFRLPFSALPGAHQTSNAGTAIAAVKAAGFEVDERACVEGLKKVQWASRMQRLNEGVLADILPQDAELWLDGGHNADGAKSAKESVARMQKQDPRPLVVICGILNNRDPQIVLSPFNNFAEMAFFVPFDYPAARPPQELADAANQIGMKCEVATSLSSAMHRIAALYENARPRVLIVGSLYLAGEVLAENRTYPT